MPDRLTPEQRHQNMSHVRSSNTKPELALRSALWHRGFRYRVNDKRLPGTPDIVLPKYRTVIFVHGCFWHGHKACKKSSIPKSNTDFWKAKITRNQERDQEIWRKLEANGWAVIIVWECELEKPAFSDTINRVESCVLQNGEAFHASQETRRIALDAYRRERQRNKEREASLISELQQLFPKR